MRFHRSAFWSGFWGKLAATVFVTVCIAFGFGPKEWVAFMTGDLPEWFTPSLARWLFLLLAIASVMSITGWGKDILIQRKWPFFHRATRKPRLGESQRVLDQPSSLPKYHEADPKQGQEIVDNLKRNVAASKRAEILRKRKIPIVEFMDEARHHGWDILSNTSLDLLNFAKRLRQAGLDGDIKFWGRAKDRMGRSTADQPRQEIPADHWKQFELDPISCMRYATNGDVAGFATNNLAVRTYRMGASVQDGSYQDICVDSSSAMDWLEKEANADKGTTEQNHGNR